MKNLITALLLLLTLPVSAAEKEVDIVVRDDTRDSVVSTWGYVFDEGTGRTNSFGIWAGYTNTSRVIYWRARRDKLYKGTNTYDARLSAAMTNGVASARLFVGTNATQYIQRMNLHPYEAVAP